MNRKVLSLFLATVLSLLLLPALFSLLQTARVAHAATFTVNIFFDENDDVCDSSCSLRDAIFAAGNGDDITIPAGTYTLSATNGTLTVSESLIFNGNSAADTFIDAQGNSRVFNVTGGTVVFNDITVQNGVAATGAGIQISGASTSVTLNNTAVYSNSATTNGGGVYLQSGSLNLQNSNIVTNTAVFDGGGIYTLRGDIVADNSTINYNVADRAGGVYVNQNSASFTLNSGEVAFNVADTVTDSFPGGGIYVGAGTATLNGGQIKFNQAYRGGGVLVLSGNAILNDAQIISNTATYGGGVYIVNETGWFTQTAGIIATNHSTATVNFGGGGIYLFNGNAELLGGQILTNTASAYGGGVEVRFGTLLVDGATISDNQAGLRGGGIYNKAGQATIQNSTISNNTAVNDGGGIAIEYDSSPSVTLIEHSAIVSNTAGSSAAGGGIFATGESITDTSIITLTNVTIGNNSAGSGAGFATEFGSTAVLTNVTLSQNSAITNGGGLRNSGGTLTVGNSIIFGNTATTGNDCNGTVTSAGNNISTCGLGGSGDISTDPSLQPLALNGGDTLNYAVGAGSSAVDAGSKILCPADDQRGNLRPIDGNGDSTATCDVGAYEYGIGFFISDASLTEGDAGSAAMSFTVTRSFITDTTYTVDYATIESGTAISGTDYTAVATTTLTFNPGDITKTVTVDILGDTLDENDETFSVVLSNQSPEVFVGDFSGTGTILDDDDAPTLSVDDVTVTEGSGGSMTAVFTATLSTASGKTITVDYETMEGSATAGSDYTAVPATTLTFNPGDTEETFSVDITTDTLDEFDETFTIELSNESNVTVTDSSAQATITDDDAAPTISIADDTVNEGNSGTTTANFVVTLSAPSGKTITVNYATAAASATAGTDYEVVTSGTLTFVPGDTAETASVTVNGDTIDENDETFLVNLSNESNVTIADGQATGTITDDDAQPTATINDVTVMEGDSGTVTAVFTVTLSAASEKTITINYNSTNGSATAGADYTAVPASVLTFDPGDPLSKTISVTVLGDEDPEDDEHFFINLTGSSNVTLGNSQGTGTIIDDDGVTVFLPFVIKP